MDVDDDLLDRIGALARARRGPLASLARAEGVAAEDAVDCVQDALCTFLGMARTGALPESEAEWAPLLGGIVRNVARNRRRRHFAALPHEPLPEDTSDAGADPATRPADEMVALAEANVRLRACVQELCTIQKAVVTLRMLEERDGEDVAQALGISSGHVAVLLHRAKRALRACMMA